MVLKRSRIEFSLSVAPKTYSYSSSYTPAFIVTATYKPSSRCPRPDDPITILTRRTILDPDLNLEHLFFEITDLTASPPKDIEQYTISACGPVERLLNSPSARFFLTLEPNKPFAFGVPFGYPERRGPPLPLGDAGRLVRGIDGMEQRSALGADGLEAGHKYKIEAVDGLRVRWWQWGRKEEVLRTEGSGSLDESEGKPIPFTAGSDGSMSCEFEITA